MNRTTSAIVGGFVGTAAMSVVLTILEVEVRYGLGVFDAIARFVRVPGDPVLGFAIYVMVGTFGWPLLFLSLERYVPLSLDPAVAGTLLGTVLWLGFAVIGRGDLAGALLLVYLAATLVAHLVYGFSMGAVYAELATHTTASDDAVSDVP
ncbi:DUF6789 family protein [Haloarcula salinisoli]|uniref:Uncharacterized protein n=1 Tax=Haloarcula salinisoli TaxID=2487746 RepID=A0A8J7YQA9_9EURY|nr:DUF6789 family protein [Halomicroarcula salinisoli]MBX0288231.1 hypothetical protein [Halomicroarcula salinisoli]MBX0305393.1 hypothetical protein [Halomicroarcula salinisoli]